MTTPDVDALRLLMETLIEGQARIRDDQRAIFGRLTDLETKLACLSGASRAWGDVVGWVGLVVAGVIGAVVTALLSRPPH